MTPEQSTIATACAAESAAGTIHFGEVVARLTAAGIERYHADYSRMETTYYTPDGGSCIAAMSHERRAIGSDFSPADVAEAVRRAQRGEVMYPEFTRLVVDAGCVGYFVQLTGRRVQYFGRRGEIHTELFPGVAAE